MQDKFLSDYIKRAQEQLDKENKKPEPEQYKVYPEPQSVDSDEKINPYSQH